MSDCNLIDLNSYRRLRVFQSDQCHKNQNLIKEQARLEETKYYTGLGFKKYI